MWQIHVGKCHPLNDSAPCAMGGAFSSMEGFPAVNVADTISGFGSGSHRLTAKRPRWRRSPTISPIPGKCVCVSFIWVGRRIAKNRPGRPSTAGIHSIVYCVLHVRCHPGIFRCIKNASKYLGSEMSTISRSRSGSHRLTAKRPQRRRSPSSPSWNRTWQRQRVNDLSQTHELPRLQPPP